MDGNLVKVEIGCGKTKARGYIGIDRYQLEGVDIVADVNQGLPFEDDSVDVIYACHSLEHMENLPFMMGEIFRVCKNKAIVQILAPYSKTSLDEANYYHKIPFNEDTFRFFTNYNTNRINPEEYYCPHSPYWGLSDSDNSNANMQFEPLKMEFFYFKEFCCLNAEQKRHARRALHNVCDQLFYVLIVNKENAPFSDMELNQLDNQARELEPELISELRNRDANCQKSDSIITDITQKTEIKYHQLELKYQNLEGEFNNLISENKKLNEIQKKTNYLMNLELDCLEERVTEFGKLKLFNDKGDLSNAIKNKSPEFVDKIIMMSNKEKTDFIFRYSKIIPSENYFEYLIRGCGEKIRFYVQSKAAACLIVEIVFAGQIIQQKAIDISEAGEQVVCFEHLQGECAIRFRAMNDYSVIRVLETIKRKMFIFERAGLTAFLE